MRTTVVRVDDREDRPRVPAHPGTTCATPSPAQVGGACAAPAGMTIAAATAVGVPAELASDDDTGLLAAYVVMAVAAA